MKKHLLLQTWASAEPDFLVHLAWISMGTRPDRRSRLKCQSNFSLVLFTRLTDIFRSLMISDTSEIHPYIISTYMYIYHIYIIYIIFSESQTSFFAFITKGFILFLRQHSSDSSKSYIYITIYSDISLYARKMKKLMFFAIIKFP